MKRPGYTYCRACGWCVEEDGADNLRRLTRDDTARCPQCRVPVHWLSATEPAAGLARALMAQAALLEV